MSCAGQRSIKKSESENTALVWSFCSLENQFGPVSQMKVFTVYGIHLLLKDGVLIELNRMAVDTYIKGGI